MEDYKVIPAKCILILANSVGGLFSFRKEVVLAILERGYKVYISVPDGDPDKQAYFIDLGCVIVKQPIERRGRNPIHDFRLLMSYCKLMKRLNPFAVLTYTIKPNIWGGIAARINHIPQLANITGFGTAINNCFFFAKFTLLLYKIGLSKAQTVFYQNSGIKDFCEKYRIGKNGILLPGSGVNLEWHTFLPYPDIAESIKFFFVGRIMKEKGIDEFIEMVNYIQVKYKNVEFHLLGRCEENYQILLGQLQKENKLVWHGRVSDVRPFIKQAHCTILPSYHEGMANVLLETCAAGRPVIATNINGCREVIDDGISGFLCKVRDSRSLIDCVEKFINLPYSIKVEMGLAARKKVEMEFDRKIVIQSYLDEIRNIDVKNKI